MKTIAQLLMHLSLILSCQLFAAETDEETTLDPKLNTALEDLDSAYDTCFAWWAKVYDAKSGGCFYCLSGKQASENGEKGFGPDIEATSKLVNVLEWTGILEVSPQEFKDGIINYMQIRQDPESGFFRDPHFAKTYSNKTLDRAAGMASGSIVKCGGMVKHPLPIEQVGKNEEADKHFAHLQNTKTLLAWLDKLPYPKRIWTFGSSLRAQSGIFKQLEEPLRGELLDLVEEYLKARQHSDGYYGSPEEDHWYSRLSGTYKAISFLEANGRTVPAVENITQTVLKDLDKQKYNNLIVLYNTANILTILNRNGANFSIEQKADIITKCTKVLNNFHCDDGGFLTRSDVPSPSANGKILGKKVMDSNTNATGLAHKTRTLLYELATGVDAVRPHKRSSDLTDVLNGFHN